MVFILSLATMAQEQGQYDKGTPPQHAAGVSPLGSYTSADLGTVNTSNGALNIKLNVGSVGGRGFWLPLTVNWSSKIWSAKTDTDTDWSGQVKTVAYADFANIDEWTDIFERIAPGWTVGVAPTLFNRIVRINRITSGPNVGCFTYTLPKLTLMLPDKGEIELRDDAFDGKPLPSDCSGYNAQSRGTHWHATDGSGTIYISDIDNAGAQFYGNLSGVVITSDGTRYHFNGSRCDSITDRNGNKITITYTNGVEITDQLGRITRIQQNVADPQNAGVTLALLVTLPGYNGQSRYYKIKSGVMSQNYRSDINPSLPVITGSYDPLSYGYSGWWGTPTRLFFHSYGLYAQRIDNMSVVNELILPDNRSLRLKYNEFGEVAEVQTPTGGKIWYDYDNIGGLPSGNSPVWETGAELHTVVDVDRAVIQRRTFPDGNALEGTWNYLYSGNSTRVTATSTSGTLMLDQRHFFLASGRYYYYPPSSSGAPDGTQNTLWSTGIEYRTETRDAAGAIIAASEQDWTQRTPLSWSSYPQEQPANDNRVNEERKILDDGSVARTHTYYQANVRDNNPTEVQAFDFDGSLKRRSVTTYVDTNTWINGFDYTSDAIHLLSLPLTQTIYDGSSNQVAQNVNEYDNYANDGNHVPLQDYGAVTQHNSNFGASYLTRGNLTRSGSWLNLTNSFIYSYPRYDDLGNVVSAKDPNGNVASISFADDFGDGSSPGGGGSGTYGATYSLPTLITSPPPQSGQPQQTARSQYDFSTGLLSGFRDRNNVVSQTIYNDPFDRPTQVKVAVNTGVESHAAMYYAPTTTPFGITLTNNDVLTAKDQAAVNDGALRSWTHTDGFGRTVQAWSRDPQGDDEVATIYDALGRPKQTSNPFRPSAAETAVYTTTSWDFAGRVISVTTPDSAVVTTSYASNTVTATDQAGKVRRSLTDGLGRLVRVDEPDANGNLGASSAPTQPTNYSYDALDNLITVNQGSQMRAFVYDSLRRLSSATNPESGTASYQYDNNGNLLVSTDARGASAHHSYDALNRAIRRWYNGSNSVTATNNNDPALPSGVGTSDEVTYVYDSATNGKGRLVSVSSSASTYSYSGYDALGRTLGCTQSVGGQAYSMSYSYDLAGHVLTQGYPSGHSVSYNFDAAGRLADKDAQNLAFTGNLGDGVPRTYASAISYDNANRWTREQFGTNTGLFNKRHYNIRGQLYDMRLSTVNDDSNWNRGAIINYYNFQNFGFGTSGSDNNGNLLIQQHWIPNDDQISGYTVHQQNYSYDSLNRIGWMAEYLNGATGTGSQVSTYDRYGNRTIDPSGSWGTGTPNQLFSIDPNTNRLGVPSEQYGTMSYDQAGNLVFDSYSGQGQIVYDAENRVNQAWANNRWQYYSYDGDGHRVKRNVDGIETWQVYGLGGELLAEYAANASALSPQKEYGYRNGELLITASNGQGCGVGYAGAKTWVGTSGNLGHLTGHAEGSNWAVYAGSDSATAMVYGPYDNTFGQGHHTAQFTLIVDNNSGSDVVATLDVVTGYGGNMLTQRQIHRNEFSGTNQWQTFTLEFDNPCFGLVEGRVWWNGTVSMKFSQLTVTPVNTSGVDIEWLVTDQLGTPRMIADQTGTLAGVKRHDYLPFGEELYAGVSGRTAQQGYTGDSVRQKFTQKERDNETGLDYFIARYYSSRLGRFTSSDYVDGNPATLLDSFERSSALPYSTLLNPQTLNSYSYAYNNPLSFIDPDGHQGKARIALYDSGGKKTGYEIRAEGGQNDSPNIHVFDRKGREVGRFSLKTAGGSWQNARKLPARIQELVKNYAESKWGAENVARGVPGRAYAEGYYARQAAEEGAEEVESGAISRGGRGASRAVAALLILQLAMDIYSAHYSEQHFGYSYDLIGRLNVTNLALAAKNLARGTRIEYKGNTYINTGTAWIDPSNCYARLEQDSNGNVRTVGGCIGE
jgi:RHS repeat-associated protein